MLYIRRPLTSFIPTHCGWPIGLVVRHPFPVREIVGSNPALVVNFLLLSSIDMGHVFLHICHYRDRLLVSYPTD